MNCPKCNAQNEETAQFCTNCGSKLHFSQELTDHSKTADLLILIFVIYEFIALIIRFLFQTFDDNWYEGTSKYFLIGINLIGGLMFLLLGISIKNKTGKIVGICIACLFTVFIIYRNLEWLFD